MDRDVDDIRKALATLSAALTSRTEEEWDRIIRVQGDNDKKDNLADIHIRVYGELIIKDDSSIPVIKLLVTTYTNIKITIDGSKNHKRHHIHIGIKEDNYHSASIAIDNGDVLNNTGNIPDWKVRKIVEWVDENKIILNKMYRCINPWGDVESAKKRKRKLSDL